MNARTADALAPEHSFRVALCDDRVVASLSAEDMSAIERAADAYVAAMSAGDWKLVAQSFAEDAVRIPPHEEPHRGRAQIEAWLGGIDELLEYELTRDALDGDGGLAYIRGRYAITLRPAGAPGPVSDQGDFLEIWRREPDGVWRVADAIWNTRLPATA
jgi:uncharacterized protein (TIGR02246 family)